MHIINNGGRSALSGRIKQRLWQWHDGGLHEIHAEPWNIVHSPLVKYMLALVGCCSCHAASAASTVHRHNAIRPTADVLLMHEM